MSDFIYKVSDIRLSFPDLSNKPLFGSAPALDVLRGISFDICRGDVVGIVGGSGSGKSTLGRVMVRLLQPDEGTVEFDGQDITDWPEDKLRPLRQRFQMIFQDPMSSLNPRQSVKQLIAGPLRVHKLGNIETRVDKALDHVGLSRNFRQRYPHELSGGQRQRVGIARAIAIEPEFILADEIVSGLDVSTQAQVLSLLDQLVAELGLTLAFISHDLSVIRKLCNRVIVMHQGCVIESNTTKLVFDTPQHEYTKELISSIALPDLQQIWE